MNVFDFLLAGKSGSRKSALITLAQEYSYADVHAAAERVSHWLGRSGGAPGDRVLIAGENSLFWVAAYLGALRCGMVAVPVAPTATRDEVAFIIANTEAHLAVCPAMLAFKLAGAFDQMSVLLDGAPGTVYERCRSFDLFSALPAHDAGPVFAAGRDTLASLMFTSGSTGQPHGVMVTHGNIIANTNSIVEYLGLTAADRIMAVLPFSYCFGTSLLHTHLRVGGSVVVDPRFPFPNKVLEHMQQRECTGFAGVPSHFQILLSKSSLKSMTFPHLRYLQQAGGHLAPVYVSELRAAVPQAELFVMYGQTEATARLAYLPPHALDAKCGSIGRAIPNVTLTIRDEAGRELPAGEVGEIVAEGDNVTLGYWRDPDETAHHFRDGRLHTGDLAYRDDDGYIYIVDRAKDFLKCGGTRTSSRKLEDKLLECGVIAEVAVIGVPDAVLGEAVKIVAVAKPGLEGDAAEAVRDFCRRNFVPNLQPREIEFLPSLPRNSAGKILKAALRGSATASANL